MRRPRGAFLVLLVLLAVAGLAAPGVAQAAVSPRSPGAGAGPAPVPAAAAEGRLRVGTLTLTRCDVLPGAWCGSIRRAWDPTGKVSGSLSVGFAFVPAGDSSQPAVGTLVPHEGGPGYSTTGTAPDYAAMYGDLLQRRNLLLVDQRGTGLSAPVYCPSLQFLTGAYAPAAARCATKLGDHFDLYSTALSADDLSAVISALRLGPVDLYGDSYGTFFAQVFLGRHPAQLRSVILDSAYPTSGEDAWYGTQGPAMETSYDKACARTPACAALGGSTMERLTKLLRVVRKKPLHGKATGADGRQHRVTIDGAALTLVAFGGTYGPATYREFDAAIRSALAGDTAPMARLVAENDFVGGDGPAEAYSEGLDAAVSCQDYPQLYDMTASPAVRAQQYAAAVQAEQQSDPTIYGPFTISEYLTSGWEEQDWCLQWPAGAPGHVSMPPTPIGGHYAAVPTLVLSGELDSITTPAEGALAAEQIPGARQVLVANSFHVTATDDTDGCGRALVQAFVQAPTAAFPAADLNCARSVPPVRAVASYARSFATSATGSPKARAAKTATLTVADVMDRWLQSIAGYGSGLRGGTWSSSGYDTARLTLHGVRLADDLAVSGTVVWHRYSHVATMKLTLTQVDRRGHRITTAHVGGTLSGSWNTRAAGARVTLIGSQGGRAVSYRFLAP